MSGRRGLAALALAGSVVLAVLAAALVAGAQTLSGDTALLDLAGAATLGAAAGLTVAHVRNHRQRA